MTKRKVLLVLGWLAVIDIVPSLVWTGILLSGWRGTLPTLPWFSVVMSLTSLPVSLLHDPPTEPAGLLAEGMVSLFLALLVPWLLFTLAARERRRAAPAAG